MPIRLPVLRPSRARRTENGARRLPPATATNSAASTARSSTSTLAHSQDKEASSEEASRPTWAAQPWPYVFHKGDSAWALGGNSTWRRVTITDEGSPASLEDRRVWPVYQASWARDGYAFRGTFAPEAGSLKPDTPHVRRLLLAEGGSNVLSTDWVFLGGDCDGDTHFSGDD